MRNRLDVKLTPPNKWRARMAVIRVDGRPLLDLIKEVESPVAAAAGETGAIASVPRNSANSR